MRRRDFLRGTATAAAVTGIAPTFGMKNAGHPNGPLQNKQFNLKYAPHFGMFRNLAGDDPLDQLQFIADEGFTALEDNGMKGKDIALQEKIASKMANLGLTMGVFVAHTIYWSEPGLAGGNKDQLKELLGEIEESVEVAKRVNAKWMTVVPGHIDPRQDMGYQTAHVVEALRRASEILEPHDLVMVLEPLNFRDHPGLFLSKAGQAYQVCRAVDSPSCKILFDIYHQQIHEGNLIPNIDLAWDEIGYFQCGDNPGRKEPTTGEINYLNVFKHIHDKGFNGIVGMEHGNSKPGAEGEKALLKAYRSVGRWVGETVGQ
ncbi:MAG: TIM barrel protein [Bacteroidales bacterium]|nr:TIM barrel protein [Bacteroidales bacterium]